MTFTIGDRVTLIDGATLEQEGAPSDWFLFMGPQPEGRCYIVSPLTHLFYAVAQADLKPDPYDPRHRVRRCACCEAVIDACDPGEASQRASGAWACGDDCDARIRAHEGWGEVGRLAGEVERLSAERDALTAPLTIDQQRRLALSYARDLDFPTNPGADPEGANKAREELAALGFDVSSDRTWTAVVRAASVGVQHLDSVLVTKGVGWAPTGGVKRPTLAPETVAYLAATKLRHVDGCMDGPNVILVARAWVDAGCPNLLKETP